MTWRPSSTSNFPASPAPVPQHYCVRPLFRPPDRDSQHSCSGPTAFHLTSTKSPRSPRRSPKGALNREYPKHPCSSWCLTSSTSPSQRFASSDRRWLRRAAPSSYFKQHPPKKTTQGKSL